MRRTVSLILLAAAYLILIASLAMCIYSVYDINCTLEALAADPAASGMDFMGIGWGYGLALFAVSTFGFVLSLITRRLNPQKPVQWMTGGAMSVYGLLIIISVFLYGV